MRLVLLIGLAIALTACSRDDAADPGTVRQKFVPVTASDAAHRSPSWSEMHPSPDGDKSVTWMQAYVGVDDTIPVREEGKQLFQLHIAEGNDETLSIDLIAGPDSQRFELHRDRGIGVNLPIGSFVVTFPSLKVAAKPGETATSSQVMLLVHHTR